MIRACVLAAAVVAACRFVPDPAPDPGARAVTIVDDDAPALAAGTRHGLVVDPRGLLAPEAYVRGGLHARGYAGTLVDPTTTWDQLQAALPAMTGEAYAVLPAADWTSDRPYGLGLGPALTNDFTIVLDGEIFLADGPNTLQLAVDDDAFFEVDLGAIRPVLRAHVNVPGSLTLSPPVAGWYPIRGAMSDQTGNAMLELSIGHGTTPQPITGDALRARVTDVHGLIVAGATNRVFATPVPATSVETTVDRDWGGGAPGYDLGVASTGFALRYAGQLRIDEPGPFVFALDVGPDPDDYARLLIDGRVVAGWWPGQIDEPASDPLDLAPGWHDVILDYSDKTGADQLRLTMATPSHAAAPIDASLLRPVRTGGLLAAAVGTTTNLVDATAAAPGVATISLPLQAPPGAVVDFADVFFQLQNEPRDQLQIALSQPAGNDTFGLGAMPDFEGTYDYLPGRTALAGAPVGAAWQAVFRDVVPGGGTGQVSYPYLIATYHGGPDAPFAEDMTYVSAPHETDGATSIDAVRAIGDLHGASLELDVRTGDATTLDGAAWVPVEDGVPPAVAPDALVQYRLTIAGDGWQAPAIDRIEIDYTTGGGS